MKPTGSTLYIATEEGPLLCNLLYKFNSLVLSLHVFSQKPSLSKMEDFNNDDLEYVFDYFEEDENDFYPDTNSDSDYSSSDSEFEDDFEMSKAKSDTSALDARNGKDIQGIPWERLNYSRDEYRQNRLKQYKNYENLSRSRENLDKECLGVQKENTFYYFQFNTRLVKSTIVHFQLRNLLCATSKHDLYLVQNYSVMHWSSLLRQGKEVLNVAKPIVPTVKHPGFVVQPVARVQVSTMTVRENLIVAGGFHGELICKNLNHSGVAFCSKISTADSAITNAVDVYRNPTGSLRVVAANNDSKFRVFDAERFYSLGCFKYDWSVNNTSVSPDGKLLAVLGDSTECLIADANTGKVTASLKGHLDYSFASAWHPDGQILATGNQDTTCRLWDIRNLSQSIAVLKGRMGAIRALSFTSDGRFLAMAEPADFVHIFDSKSGYAQGQEIDLFGEIAGISFSPDTEALFVGIADRTYGSLLEFTRRHQYNYLDSMF
ncbi:putative transcription factor WD40-like family [Lupinus albus]|uniref:Putative transcription factor WD40-like family n=1 Tax=Lupinus albus TaxID=3870 RepID=A0A6A4Q5L2_LUPAL|nr:putative transcription factor WD40-like family [Lupinus albus]